MLPKFEMIKCSVLLFTSPIFDFEVKTNWIEMFHAFI